ncbi:hypothetical protein [Clostridium estertheticum]|uniref:hypothetical protein n=1 Tax=Clostridium estertheticum TaxID=238834 RepID=UPI001CF17071|nr:hypothetical protein [Clostridium estertheticum]MCB2339097.1 hypothetical protein [Clostridium estertheticum]
MLKTCTKLGFKFFNSYIDGIHYNKVTLFQYYFGKLLDIFMLGYIFSKLTEQRFMEKKTSIKEQVYSEDLNRQTRLIKKTRDINMKRIKK